MCNKPIGKHSIYAFVHCHVEIHVSKRVTAFSWIFSGHACEFKTSVFVQHESLEAVSESAYPLDRSQEYRNVVLADKETGKKHKRDD